MIRYEKMTITTSALGAGTATTSAPIIGEIIEVCAPGTVWSSTADFALVRDADYGGTILSLTDAQVPWQHFPRAQLVTSGTAAITNSYDRFASDDYLTLTVAGAGSVATDSVYVIYDDLS
jgi:hypothetical protein